MKGKLLNIKYWVKKINLSEILFRLKSKFFRLKIKWSSDPRPSSYPYISGDGFRKIADHIYDETGKCQPEEIKEGEIVFIKSDYLHEYFKNTHPLIKYPYKLISHNSDYNIKEKDLSYIDNKIIHWYAQNVTVNHPKLTPLPIGLENLHIYINGIVNNFDYLMQPSPKGKKNKILSGFNKNTNLAEREPAEEVLRGNPLVDKIKNRTNPDSYVKLLNQYKFVASPPGNGLDCHRTWEAMYLDVIPIVKMSVITESFKKLGLPLLEVNNWAEVKNISEEYLKDTYKNLLSNSNKNPLFMKYWEEFIKKSKS